MLTKTSRLLSYKNLSHWWTIAVYAAVFALSGLLAFLLRFDFKLENRSLFALALPVWVLTKCVAFRVCRLFRGSWRHASVAHALRLLRANLLGCIASVPVVLFLSGFHFPRSIFLLDFLVCTLITSMLLVLARAWAEPGFGANSGTKRVVVYGAGAAGIALAREMRLNPSLKRRVCGYVDDDPHKAHLFIDGIPILGGGDVLADLAAKHRIEEVLIAIPSAGGAEMTQILEHCHAAKLPCKTVPGLADMILGSNLSSQIREVAVEDLLGRQSIHLEEEEIRAAIEGNVILVTGAAGSIGSEICRQVAGFRPAGIVALEIGETALFHLEDTMRSKYPDVPFYAQIGSIQDVERLTDVFSSYRPSVVFHAAAYKHVPMMERHVFQAVRNNIFGTYNVARAAGRFDVRKFVMISTDKAVHPTSIMGVSKRVAEMVVRSMAPDGAEFVSVRFGNVLGSNGSVIPIFKSQIAAGGPVRVTHPDMRRFFMTIPEAVQLVLQASTMGKGGEIFVLDMGEPVKIVDMARKLILLSGLRPGVDIQIEFTGCRPGEKLHEELHRLEEHTVPTYHEKIKIFQGDTLPVSRLNSHLSALLRACDGRDAGALLLELKEMVPDYNPSSSVLSCILARTAVA